MLGQIRSSTTLTISTAMAVDAIINAVKLRNVGKAVEKVPIQNKLTRFSTRTALKTLYQKLTGNLASKAPKLARYIICFYVAADMIFLFFLFACSNILFFLQKKLDPITDNPRFKTRELSFCSDHKKSTMTYDIYNLLKNLLLRERP